MTYPSAGDNQASLQQNKAAFKPSNANTGQRLTIKAGGGVDQKRINCEITATLQQQMALTTVHDQKQAALDNQLLAVNEVSIVQKAVTVLCRARTSAHFSSDCWFH